MYQWVTKLDLFTMCVMDDIMVDDGMDALVSNKLIKIELYCSTLSYPIG